MIQKLIFLLFNLLIFTFHFVNSYVFTGTEIRDLFKKDVNFAQDALLWDASKTSSTGFTSICSDYYPVVGGQNILGDPTTHLSLNEYFFRTYTGLPTHTVIYYTITLYALDQWNKLATNNDGFNLKFDATTVTGFVSVNGNRFYESIGGNPHHRDLRNLRVFGRVAHVPTSLTLQIISLLHDVNTIQSFGFREINLIFDNPGTPPANLICGAAPTGLTGAAGTTFSEACFCPEGQWGTVSCTTCHTACSSCWAAGSSSCFQCAPGYSWISGACTACSTGCTACHGTGYTQCDDCQFGLFLINGECVNSCPLPLTNQIINGITQCVTPCTLTQYVYWDGSCNSTCSFPLQSFTLFDNILTCQYPCTDGQFLYSNGRCSGTCTSPLLPVAQSGQQLCKTPCASGEYLYPDSTCSADCDYPMTFELTDGVLYCRYTCTGTNFLYWDQACRSTCAKPLSQRFAYGGLRFCDFPLTDTTQYLYYDGTGADSCPLPLTSSTLGTIVIRNFCNYGCNPLTQYLYWDQNCRATCTFPLVETSNGNWRFCSYPCAMAGEWLYFNGTCSTSCPVADFNQRTTYSVQFCDDKCPTGQYQYWDGLCLPTCDSGLTIYTGNAANPALFCVYPCASGTEFLYWNGTCKTECDFPLTQRTFKTEQFCDFPCGINEYLFYNGSCGLNCPLPYVEQRDNDKPFCNFPCLQTEYLFWNGTCLADCPKPLTIEADPIYGFYCKTPCPSQFEFYIPETKKCVKNCRIFPQYKEGLYQICVPAGADIYEGFPNLFLLRQESKVSMLTTAKLSRHIEILQIQRTPRLKYFLETRGVNLLYFKLGLPMSEKEMLAIDYHEVDERFQILSMHSNFIVNDYRSLLPIFWALVSTVAAYLIHYICKTCKYTTYEPYFAKIKNIAFLNLMFIMVVINIDDTILFGVVYYMSMELNTRFEAYAFGAASGLLIGSVLILITTVVLVHKYQKVKKEAIETHRFDNYVKFLTKYQSCCVLYRGFREEKKVQQLFFMIYVIRVALPVILGFIFLNFPNPLTFFQLTISFAMITYMLYFDPVKSRINTVNLLILEGATLLINLAAFLTAMFDAGGLQSGRAYTLLGDFIVGGNVFMNVATWVLFPVKIGFEIRRILKIRREKKDTHASIWFNLLVIFVQFQAFGFEEMIEDPKLAKETLMNSHEVSSEMWAKHLKIQNKRPPELLPLSADGTMPGTPDLDLTGGSFQNSPMHSKGDDASPVSSLVRKKFDFTPLRKSRLSTRTTGWRSSINATPTSPFSAGMEGVEDVILEKTNEEESKTVQDPFKKARGQDFEEVDLALRKTGSNIKYTEENNETVGSHRHNRQSVVDGNFNREHTPLAAWIRKPARSRFTINNTLQTPPKSSRGDEDVSFASPWKEGGSFASSNHNLIESRSQAGLDTTGNLPRPRDSQFVEDISPSYNVRRSMIRRSQRADTYNRSFGRGLLKPEEGSTIEGSHTERTEDVENNEVYRL